MTENVRQWRHDLRHHPLQPAAVLMSATCGLLLFVFLAAYTMARFA